MKSLKNYIFEDFDTFRIQDLEVPYNVTYNKNNIITFKVPSTYSEDDLQIYLQDKYLNELPASDKTSEKFFGKNKDNIYDVLFDYEKYEKSDDENKDAIDWDEQIGNNQTNVNEFSYASITNLKYIIKFDEFDLKNINGHDDKINDSLIIIFKNADSSDINKYPLTISLDDKNIKYTEE